MNAREELLKKLPPIALRKKNGTYIWILIRMIEMAL